MIKVEYLMHSGSDNGVANAARVSFAYFHNWGDIPEEYTEAKRDRLLKYLAKHEHTSPFRHTSITVRCSAPVFLARQLMKHQAGLSWNEESRRYIDTDPEFFYPEAWRAKPEGSIKQGSAGLVENQELYEEYYIRSLQHAKDCYDRMLLGGVAPEMARMVLPQSMIVNWVWTGNLLSFFHVTSCSVTLCPLTCLTLTSRFEG